MASKPNLKEMFQEWDELNIKAQESMGQFDFAKRTPGDLHRI